MDKDSSLHLETLPIWIRKPCLCHSFFILDSFSFLDLENFFVASLETIWILTFLHQVGNLVWVEIFILLGIHLQLGIPRRLGILCWLGFHLLIRRFPTSNRKPFFQVGNIIFKSSISSILLAPSIWCPFQALNCSKRLQNASFCILCP